MRLPRLNPVSVSLAVTLLYNVAGNLVSSWLQANVSKPLGDFVASPWSSIVVLVAVFVILWWTQGRSGSGSPELNSTDQRDALIAQFQQENLQLQAELKPYRRNALFERFRGLNETATIFINDLRESANADSPNRSRADIASWEADVVDALKDSPEDVHAFGANPDPTLIGNGPLRDQLTARMEIKHRIFQRLISRRGWP